jgi:DNA polymerase sigma
MGEVLVTPFGSARNHFWTADSDIDINVYFLERQALSQKSLLNKLRDVVKALAIPGTMVFIDAQRVKLWRFHVKGSGIQVDLSVNNHMGAITSDLISAYASVD